MLDMVTDNRGREARKSLLSTYDARREARNARDRALRRGRAESAAISNLSKRLPEARSGSLERNAEQMSYKDLRFAKNATRDELKAAAASGHRITIDGVEVNLFWYH